MSIISELKQAIIIFYDFFFDNIFVIETSLFNFKNVWKTTDLLQWECHNSTSRSTIYSRPWRYYASGMCLHYCIIIYGYLYYFRFLNFLKITLELIMSTVEWCIHHLNDVYCLEHVIPLLQLNLINYLK